MKMVNPPAREASREAANLTERKICIPLYMVSKNLSVYKLKICSLNRTRMGLNVYSPEELFVLAQNGDVTE